MRYEVRLQDARFYVSSPDIMAAECEANWFMDNAGILGDINEINLTESADDED